MADPYGHVCPECKAPAMSISGVQIQGVYDGICFWLCKNCGHRWHRFEPPGRITDAVEKYWKEPTP